TDAFVREFFKSEKLEGLFTVTVSEAGASVYSASDVARQEFPDLDLTVRGAISIARRLQDPLSELVKIDPKSIGVGQYQHDVDQAAGFLRIRNGDNPLDSTAVHPESYNIVEQIAGALKVSVTELITRPELLAKVDAATIAAGTYTLNDILEELRKPGRDPRDK